ncbi:hypothetical protein [Aquihabitans sp. McL0605]|uniref:COG4705 family protein n=1 Tax=Aquihabitans sp. McL0605 TaxID=3415671 RepID=UPI003CE97ADF
MTSPAAPIGGTAATLDDQRAGPALLVKVPEVLVWFWIVKVATTALGESVSDYLVNRYDPVLVVVVGFVAFAAALAWQFRVPRYVAWVYWSTALMVSTFGTMAADVAHVGLGIPYAVSTALSSAVLAATFVVWFRTEQTLSIHSISTTRREAFYWATALVTFALGTAVGDLTAVTLHLGYLSSGILFGIVFALAGIAWRVGLNPVVAFWWAYIATRPFGASFADWFAKPTASGGLGYGQGPVSLVLAVVIVTGVTYLAVSRIDDPNGSQRS